MALTKVVQDALHALQDAEGELDPKSVVEAARDDASHVLHGYFEWRDGVAGELYRLGQARKLIGQYKVDAPTATRTVHVSTFVANPASKKYRNIIEAMPVEADTKAKMYERELSRARSTVERFTAMAAVFGKLEDVEQLRSIIDRALTPDGTAEEGVSAPTTKTLQ